MADIQADIEMKVPNAMIISSYASQNPENDRVYLDIKTQKGSDLTVTVHRNDLPLLVLGTLTILARGVVFGQGKDKRQILDGVRVDFKPNS